MRIRFLAPLALAAACVLALGACSRPTDPNANAPGSPGTGNPTEVVRPSAPDSPPGGPSGIAGSVPHPGSSGGDAPSGVTGAGTVDRTQPRQPGEGLHGGLGSSSAMGSAPAAGSATMAPAGGGSANTTSGSAVGSRP
jgi:hypothetical protein